MEIDVRDQIVRTQESGFANYVADVIRADVDADVGITNGGGIRTDQTYEAGELTRQNIVSILPFPNETCAVELTGADIVAALEHGVSTVEETHGRFPHVSGMEYSYDPTASAGERIESVTIDGIPIDETETFSVATNDFLLGGGDGYEMFAEAEVLVRPEVGQELSVAVTDAIQEDTPITPEPDGRITVLEELPTSEVTESYPRPAAD